MAVTTVLVIIVGSLRPSARLQDTGIFASRILCMKHTAQCAAQGHTPLRYCQFVWQDGSQQEAAELLLFQL